EKVGPEYWSGPTAPSSAPPAPPSRVTPLVPSGPSAQRPSGTQCMSMTYLGVRYASALASVDMRSGVSNSSSANVCTATTNMSTKVFTATATEMFTATAMAATAMAAPTALGHRRLSAQIYQRPERNGHRKYFDKFDCHRPLHCGKKTCARALSSISRHFALHSRRPWVKSRHVQT